MFLMMPLDTISCTTGQVSVFTKSFVARVRGVMHLVCAMVRALARPHSAREGSRTRKCTVAVRVS